MGVHSPEGPPVREPGPALNNYFSYLNIAVPTPVLRTTRSFSGRGFCMGVVPVMCTYALHIIIDGKHSLHPTEPPNIAKNAPRAQHSHATDVRSSHERAQKSAGASSIAC